MIKITICTITIFVLGFTGSAPPEKEVMESNDSEVFIRTTTYEYNETDTIIESKEFKRIGFTGEHIDCDTIRAGKPQIPYIMLLVAVPDSCDLEITCYESRYTIFDDYLLYPIPRIEFEIDTAGNFRYEEVYTYDTSFYNTDTVYPGKFYEVVNDGYWRDQRVVQIHVYPVQCNPSTKKMFFYNDIDIKIEYDGQVVQNENGLGPFDALGREILLNYEGVEWNPGIRPDPVVHYYDSLHVEDSLADYLIISHDHFLISETGNYWINEFAQWRVDHNEFDVGIVSMADVYREFLEGFTRDDSSKALRDFLIYAYDNWKACAIPDSHFAHCLFIGDWDYVPTKIEIVQDHSHPQYDWVKANEYYFKDLKPEMGEEIMLGRWPCKSVQELVTIAQKTINYESNPDTHTWRRQGLLSAGYDADYDFNRYVDNGKPFFSDIGYDTIAIRYTDTWSVDSFCDSMQKYFNEGEIIAAYFNHGAPEGWYGGYDTTYIKALTNGSRLPAVFSMACFTANFTWDHDSNTHVDYPPSTCFAEHFLFNQNGGCVAYHGATIWTIPTFHVKEILRRILRYQHWILGISAANLTFIQAVKTDYCLLGDPALDLGDYTAYPDLPDLVVRPPDEYVSDINILSPHPYHTTGDTIPIGVTVWNIGGTAAQNVEVRVRVQKGMLIIVDSTVTFSQILPRDSVTAIIYWDTDQTHPGYYGEIGDCMISVMADPDNDIDESWELNNDAMIIETIALFPNEKGWPKKIRGYTPPAIANLDGAGSVEIVYAAEDSIYVFDYEGTVIDGWPQCFKRVIGIVLGDIDCMGDIEIVAVSQDSIKVYDHDGTIVWKVEHPSAYPDYFGGLPAMGYITGADKRQIAIFNVAKETYPRVLVYDYDGDLLYAFQNSEIANGNSCSRGPVISDINADGKDEIVLSYGLFPSNPETYDYIGTDVFNSSQTTPILVFDSCGNHLAIPALADVDHPTDGYAEIIFSNYDTLMMAYKATSQETLYRVETKGPIFSSPAVGNINNGLGYPGVEVAFDNDSSQIEAIRGYHGTTWDPYWFYLEGSIQESPVLAKLEGAGDHDVDIIIPTGYWNPDDHAWHVLALNCDGDTLEPYRPLLLFGKPCSPVIGDIDGDRKSEAVLTTGDGYLHVWENVSSKTQRYQLEWPQFHHDYQRTGFYDWVGGLSGGDANPEEFSTATTISFSLDKETHMHVTVYDIDGHLVKTLVDQILPKGSYNPIWYGKNNNFALLPNGLYFVELKAGYERKFVPVTINR